MQSLRGVKAKEKFVQDYMNIKVLAYRVLLNGDMRKNQCGGKLTNRELFDLINLIWIGLSLQNIDILHDIQNKLYENPDKEPPPSHFKSLNTILNKWNTTIQSIIAKLQQNNRNFRNFDFTQAREYLKEYFEKNNINDTIQF